jgi:phage terminase large subunit-like protein
MSDGKVKTMYMRRESPWLAFGFVLALAALFASTRLAPAEAGGEVVSPEAGLTVVLGAANVSIFYQPTAAGFHVVATAGSDNSDNVIRFVSTLKPGQETEISVPRAVGQSAIALRLHRNGDVLELLRPVS